MHTSQYAPVCPSAHRLPVRLSFPLQYAGVGHSFTFSEVAEVRQKPSSTTIVSIVYAVSLSLHSEPSGHSMHSPFFKKYLEKDPGVGNE